MKSVKLTQLTKSAGWAAKIGPKDLAKALEKIPQKYHENLIVGYEHSDDAAVYKIDNDKALIQTLDFFTPVVDDPYLFGSIAAANSLSDIYAMGGKPILAMNIVCFPNCLDMEMLGEILRGGYEKVAESGAILVGGHSVEDDEPKYGLSVTGMTNPKNVLTNAGAKEGDLLVLTKPLGSGILNTAIKGDIIEKSHYEEVVKIMSHLNMYAAIPFEKLKVHAVTDITGFGLIGHLVEMAKGSNTTIVIETKTIPVIDGAFDYAKMGIIPAGMYNNREYFEHEVIYQNDKFKSSILCDILYDPQTSGGLLVSLPESEAIEYMKILNSTQAIKCEIIGRVTSKKDKYIVLE